MATTLNSLIIEMPPDESGDHNDVKDDHTEEEEITVCGIVFGRAIRASLAFFQLALLEDDDDDDDYQQGEEEEDDPVKIALVMMNFSMPPSPKEEDNNKQDEEPNDPTTTSSAHRRQSNFRSSFRKCCNYGDLVVVRGGKWIYSKQKQQLPNAEDETTEADCTNSNSNNNNNMPCTKCYMVSLPLTPNMTSSSSSSSSSSSTRAKIIMMPTDNVVKHHFHVKIPKQWTIQQCQQAAASWQRQRALLGTTLYASSGIPIPRIGARNGMGQQQQQQQQRPRRRQHSPIPPSYRKPSVDVAMMMMTPGIPGAHHRDPIDPTADRDETTQQSHGRVVAKRTQGEYLANFLIHMMTYKITIEGSRPIQQADPSSSWHHIPPSALSYDNNNNTSLFDIPQGTMNLLNQGTGVLDVAGGSGHVSMALSLRGITSTIVDPRPHVGMLPRRDRKFFAKRQQQQQQQQQRVLVVQGKAEEDQPLSPVDSMPVTDRPNSDDDNDRNNNNGSSHIQRPYTTNAPVEFQTFRAWFGPPTEWHRHGECQQVCTVEHALVRNCSAIVALHPDEATDAIVDMAVQLRIPFCIVPCCVFARWYPHRRLRNRNPVHTYQDLLDYLQEKDDSIQRSILPFEGANTILWSTF
jgi:hypothetical protein